jgi:hypothetical protein
LRADWTEYEKKAERKWEGRARQLGMQWPMFTDYNDFVQKLKGAEVRNLTDEIDNRIHNRSHTSSIDSLKGLVSSYANSGGAPPRDVDRIVNGFETGAAMPLPIVVEGTSGAWIMAGNTRLDTAGILGLPKQALWVDLK